MAFKGVITNKRQFINWMGQHQLKIKGNFMIGYQQLKIKTRRQKKKSNHLNLSNHCAFSNICIPA